MKDLYLCPHYGFGDYVIIYGLVKELSKRYDNIVLFVKPHRSRLHVDNICRLYDSIPNVEILPNDPLNYKDVLYLGWDKFAEYIKTDSQTSFAKFFYDQAEVPINLMWDNSYFERDMDRELRIYFDLGLEGEEYVFLHDDPGRNFIINKNYVSSGMRIIHLIDLPEISVLDTLLLIERAKEVHTFTTGLVPFIDQMNIQHDSLNLHRYIRPLPYDQPILRLNWNIIK